MKRVRLLDYTTQPFQVHFLRTLPWFPRTRLMVYFSKLITQYKYQSPKKKLLAWLYLIGISTGVMVLIYLAVSAWVGLSVREQCLKAQRQYGLECVDALMATVGDEMNSFRTKNDAVWSLGQLGDVKALTILNQYYTGEIPQRESYDEVLSQYEIKKAIALLESGLNVTAWLWR